MTPFFTAKVLSTGLGVTRRKNWNCTDGIEEKNIEVM